MYSVYGIINTLSLCLVATVKFCSHFPRNLVFLIWRDKNNKKASRSICLLHSQFTIMRRPEYIRQVKAYVAFSLHVSGHLYLRPSPVTFFKGSGDQASGCQVCPKCSFCSFHGDFSCLSLDPAASPTSLFKFPHKLSGVFVVPSTCPYLIPSPTFRGRGLSSSDGFAAHRASAACTRCFSSLCRKASACCSDMVGGAVLV